MFRGLIPRRYHPQHDSTEGHVARSGHDCRGHENENGLNDEDVLVVQLLDRHGPCDVTDELHYSRPVSRTPSIIKCGVKDGDEQIRITYKGLPDSSPTRTKRDAERSVRDSPTRRLHIGRQKQLRPRKMDHSCISLPLHTEQGFCQMDPQWHRVRSALQ